MDEPSKSGQNSSRDQYPRDPDASSDLVQQEIAGDLEKAVTEKENPGCESELLAGHRQLLVHRQRGEPDVDAVNERDNIENEQERQESELQLSDGPPFDCPGVKRAANRAFCSGGAGLEFSLLGQE